MAGPRRGEPGNDAAIPGVAHTLRCKMVSIITSTLTGHHWPHSTMQDGQYHYQYLNRPPLVTLYDARWSVSLPVP
jgi:hypothetical protein